MLLSIPSKKGEFPVDQKKAVLFMPDNITCTKDETPLILQPILFCPIFTWMVAELMGRGVERFFIVSDKDAHEMLRAHLPADADALFIDGARHGEELLAALGDCDESLLVVNGAVLPVGVFSGGAVYAAGAKECCAVLREHGAFAAFPAGAQVMQGFLPVGDEEELRQAASMCRRAIIDKHIKNGVMMLDENAVYIDPRVKIGRGTMLLPGTILRGESVIGEGCTIGPNAMVRDCTVGDGTEVNASQINESVIGKNTNVGPFAYVRPGSKIGDKVKVGDFVEVKNSVIGNGTKISHLTYVGDSDCGERINFGCGTITTNYDGFKKYRCTIGDDSFIGCNTNLVAPVTVGKGSYIAAGSTITEEVPEDALAIGRVKQSVKEGWAKRRRDERKK